MGDPEASEYVGPQEFADLEVCYAAEYFSFNPFGEVVSDYQKEDLLPWRHRKFPYYIDAPLSEGPWRAYGLEVLRGKLRDWSLPLALVAVLGLSVGVGEHHGPIVTGPSGSEHQASTARVGSTISFM